MSKPSSPSRLLLVAATCSVASLSVAAALLLAPPSPVPHRTAAARVYVPGDLNIERLRQDAASLDAEASRMLAARLLARYESAGDADDLYEALLWIERDWHRPEWVESPLVSQFVERHCGQKVVRWSTLCDGGD